MKKEESTAPRLPRLPRSFCHCLGGRPGCNDERSCSCRSSCAGTGEMSLAVPSVSAARPASGACQWLQGPGFCGLSRFPLCWGSRVRSRWSLWTVRPRERGRGLSGTAVSEKRPGTVRRWPGQQAARASWRTVSTQFMPAEHLLRARSRSPPPGWALSGERGRQQALLILGG